MARRRGGIKRLVRRALAIASGKDKLVNGHNIPDQCKQLYRELEPISNAAFAEFKPQRKPTVVSNERLRTTYYKNILVHVAGRNLWVKTHLVPARTKAPVISVVTLD